jgi:hypothetical protein
MVHTRLKIYFKVDNRPKILLSTNTNIVFDVWFRRDLDKLPIIRVKLVDKGISYILYVIDWTHFYFLHANSIFQILISRTYHPVFFITNISRYIIPLRPSNIFLFNTKLRLVLARESIRIPRSRHRKVIAFAPLPAKQVSVWDSLVLSIPRLLVDTALPIFGIVARPPSVDLGGVVFEIVFKFKHFVASPL